MHILSLKDISRDGNSHILDRAAAYLQNLRQKAEIPAVLKKKVILNAFFEDSTRTRVSFEMAALRLGATVIPFSVASSSLKKGEDIIDTLKTLAAMHPDAFVVRATQDQMPQWAAEHMNCPVLNAGNGTQEHPTQALLDALTLREHFGCLENLKIAICGDIRHSRVAGSNILLLQKYGAQIRLVGPESLLPEDRQAALHYSTELNEALEDVDVVMMLRIQKERLQKDIGFTDADYFAQYGLTSARLEKYAPHAMVMHPGPMNRGIEISAEVADDPDRSLILKQVEANVTVRMACLEEAILN